MACCVLFGLIAVSESPSWGSEARLLSDGSSHKWMIGERKIWDFPFDSEDEAQEVVDAYNKAYQEGFSVPSIRVSAENNKWFVVVGKQRVVEAIKEHSGSVPPKLMAYACVSRIYGAIAEVGAQPMTEKHRIKGVRELSGTISWYGGALIGRKTANGERLDPHDLTAAAKNLPFGTMVRLRNLVNGKTVVVRVTDRFAEHRGRVLDISQAAAELLGIKSQGVAKVGVEVLGQVQKKVGGK